MMVRNTLNNNRGNIVTRDGSRDLLEALREVGLSIYLHEFEHLSATLVICTSIFRYRYLITYHQFH